MLGGRGFSFFDTLDVAVEAPHDAEDDHAQDDPAQPLDGLATIPARDQEQEQERGEVEPAGLQKGDHEECHRQDDEQPVDRLAFAALQITDNEKRQQPDGGGEIERGGVRGHRLDLVHGRKPAREIGIEFRRRPVEVPPLHEEGEGECRACGDEEGDLFSATADEVEHDHGDKQEKRFVERAPHRETPEETRRDRSGAARFPAIPFEAKRGGDQDEVEALVIGSGKGRGPDLTREGGESQEEQCAGAEGPIARPPEDESHEHEIKQRRDQGTGPVEGIRSEELGGKVDSENEEIEGQRGGGGHALGVIFLRVKALDEAVAVEDALHAGETGIRVRFDLVDDGVRLSLRVGFLVEPVAGIIVAEEESEHEAQEEKEPR